MGLLERMANSLKDIWAFARSVLAFIGTFGGVLTSIALIRQTIAGEPSWVWWSAAIAAVALSAVYLNFKKTDVASKIGFDVSPQATSPYAYPRWVRIGSIVLFTMTAGLLTALTFGRGLFEQATPASFTVLVADFDGPPGYGLTEMAIEGLRKTTKDFPAVRVVPLKQPITAQDGNEVARRIGAESNANVVIWGWYRRSGERVVTTLHVELLGPYKARFNHNPEGTKYFPASDLEHFVIQQELTSELTPMALLLVAIWKFDLNDYSSARNLLTKAIDSAPQKSVFSVFNLAPAHFYRAEATFHLQTNFNARLESSSNSVADLTKSIELDPEFVPAYANRASHYVFQDKWSEALRDCEDVLKRDPNFWVAYATKATALAQLGRISEALEAIESALKLTSIAEQRGGIYAMRANIYSHSQQHQKAIEDDTRALELTPEIKVAALYNRAIAYQALQQFDKAISDLNEVCRLEPSRAFPFRNRGNCFFKVGQIRKAIADYDMAIARWPEDAESHLNRGQAFRLLGQPAKALVDVQRAQKLDTNSSLACFFAGMCFLNLSNLIDAETNFSAAIQRDGSHWDSYSKRAFVKLLKGDLRAAITDYDKALNGSPSDPKEAHLYRGQAYFVLGENAAAILDMERVVGLNSEVDAKYVTARLNQAERLHREENYEQALTEFVKVVELQPTNIVAIYSLGICYRELGRTSDALQKINEVLKLDPQFAPAWYAEGLILFRNIRNLTNAMECFDKALQFASSFPERSPPIGTPEIAKTFSFNALVEKGNCAAELGNHILAIDCFSKAAESEQATPGIYVNMANSMMALGRYPEADLMYAKTVSLGFTNSSVFKYWGISQIFQGRNTNAILQLEKCIGLDPTDGECFFRLGDALATTSPQEALTKYARASELGVTNPLVYINWGNTLMNLGRLLEAEEKYCLALALSDQYVDLHRNLGVCLWRLKRYDEAQEHLERVRSIAPTDGIANNLLGLQYASYHRTNEAIEAFNAVLKWHPGTSIAETASKALEGLKAGNLKVLK